MRVYTVLEDDVDTADVDDCEAETGRAIALAECNYFTAVVLGYGVPTVDSRRPT